MNLNFLLFESTFFSLERDGREEVDEDDELEPESLDWLLKLSSLSFALSLRAGGTTLADACCWLPVAGNGCDNEKSIAGLFGS
jgi:hypothetical protein